MANLSPGQFPDYVPENLALPAAQPRAFNPYHSYGQGSDVPQKQIDSWKATEEKTGKPLIPRAVFQDGGSTHGIVPAYAPTEEDFKDMGPPKVKEGIVPSTDRYKISNRGVTALPMDNFKGFTQKGKKGPQSMIINSRGRPVP